VIGIVLAGVVTYHLTFWARRVCLIESAKSN
jgi:hypothetical protein